VEIYKRWSPDAFRAVQASKKAKVLQDKLAVAEAIYDKLKSGNWQLKNKQIADTT
jgi:hypothetical protein